jgi:hypothetical protein
MSERPGLFRDVNKHNKASLPDPKETPEHLAPLAPQELPVPRISFNSLFPQTISLFHDPATIAHLHALLQAIKAYADPSAYLYISVHPLFFLFFMIHHPNKSPH